MSARDEQADDNDLRIGRKVAEARERAGLSQEYVAGHVGLTRSSVANIEAGRQRVHAARLAMLAKMLGIDVSELLADIELPPLPPVPHRVTIKLAWEVTCETCSPGQPFDAAGSREQAVKARQAHIAETLEARRHDH
jgi:transcriptional regulator with XRE-family HTH domain